MSDLFAVWFHGRDGVASGEGALWQGSAERVVGPSIIPHSVAAVNPASRGASPNCDYRRRSGTPYGYSSPRSTFSYGSASRKVVPTKGSGASTTTMVRA